MILTSYRKLTIYLPKLHHTQFSGTSNGTFS